MHRNTRPVFAFSMAIAALVGLTACGSKTTAAGTTAPSVETTVATPETTVATPETTVPTSTETTVPTSTAPATGTGEAFDASGKFRIVDLGTKLEPIPGFTYQPLDVAIQTQMLSGFATDANIVELVNTIGTSVATNDTDKALLMALGLNRVLVGTELMDFVTGVIGTGTDVQQGEVAGTRGWTYVDGSGSKAFVTVRNDTAILCLTDSSDVLAKVVSGLFAANPNL